MSDQDEAFAKLRGVERCLEDTIEQTAGFSVQQNQWIIGKNPGDANLLNVIIRVDFEILFAPGPPEHDMIASEEQAGFNAAFDDIISGKKVDDHEDQVKEAREQAKQAVAELEDEI